MRLRSTPISSPEPAWSGLTRLLDGQENVAHRFVYLLSAAESLPHKIRALMEDSGFRQHHTQRFIGNTGFGIKLGRISRTLKAPASTTKMISEIRRRRLRVFILITGGKEGGKNAEHDGRD